MIGEVLLANKADLLVWAIAVGRVPAKDSALWTARLAGSGADAYAQTLLFGDPSKVVTFP